MNLSRIKSFVGFSVKARKIIFGVDNILTAGRKKPFVILLSPALSNNSTDKVKSYAEKMDIEVFTVDLATILPDRNCKAVGLTEENLAKAVKSELKEA